MAVPDFGSLVEVPPEPARELSRAERVGRVYPAAFVSDASARPQGDEGTGDLPDFATLQEAPAAGPSGGPDLGSLQELTPGEVSRRLDDPHYVPSQGEFELWKKSKDAEPWFQPAHWVDKFVEGASGLAKTLWGGVKELPIARAKAVAAHPLKEAGDYAQTAAEAVARGTLNDLTLGGKVLQATGERVRKVGEGFLQAAGVDVNGMEDAYITKRTDDLNREAFPGGNAPGVEWLRPETVPSELREGWKKEFRTRVLPALEYQTFVSSRATDAKLSDIAQGKSNLVPAVAGQPKQELANAASLVASPVGVATLGMGGAGESILQRMVAGAAESGGKALTRGGQVVESVAGLPKRAASAAAEAVTESPDAAAAAERMAETGGVHSTAVSPGLAIPGMHTLAEVANTLKAGSKVVTQSGEALQAAGRSLRQGTSRSGFLATIATDGEAPLWVRKAARASMALDPALELGGRALESGLHGAGIGGVIGGYTDGMEGAASGAGAGFALGVGLGVPSRFLSRDAILEAKRQGDLNRWFNSKSEDEQGNIASMGLTKEQALRFATLEQFIRGVRGANGESDVHFVYATDPVFQNAFGTSAKGAEMVSGDRPTIVVNVDKGDWRTLGHEGMHGLLDLAVSPESKLELTRKLFTQTAPDGTVLSHGVFSPDDVTAFEKQYVARMSGTMQKEWQLMSPEQRQWKVRGEIASDAFDNLVSGKQPDFLLKVNGLRARLADRLIQAQGPSLLGRLRAGLEAVGVKFDASGTPSQLFARNGVPITNSPTVDAALRDYMRAKARVVSRLSAAEDGLSGIAVTRQDMMSKNGKVIAELFKDNDNFKKDKAGNLVLQSGQPVLLSDAQIRELQAKRVGKMIEALETAGTAGGGGGSGKPPGTGGHAPGGSAPDPRLRLQPMRKKDNGAWEGHYFTDAQLEAIDRIPNDVLAPSLKMKIRQLNGFHGAGDGTRYVIDYNAATKENKGGKRVYSSAIRSTLRDVVPITMHISKAGNFYSTTLDVTKLWSKLSRWQKEHPKTFDPWGGNRDGFLADVYKYLNNHANDLPGGTGLDAGAATAVHKRNIINDLLGVARGTGANPIELSGKGDKDSVVRSFRFDRTNRITDSGGEKMPFDYYKAKANFLPAERRQAEARAVIEDGLQTVQQHEDALRDGRVLADRKATKGHVDGILAAQKTMLQAQREAARGRANFLPGDKPAEGKEWKATTPSQAVPVKGRYILVDAKDLVTSFDKGFDPTLQPRDRTREASVNQIATIVQKFEPQRLGEAPTTDMGAPVVDERNQVLSGNGRVSSIRTIYRSEEPSRAAAYRDYLTRNAGQFGLKAEDVGAMAEPVLVRRVEDYNGLAKAEFARQSNQSQLLAMSGAEKAAVDARMLSETPALLDLFRPSDEGNVMAESNREFLNHFIAATGDGAELLTGKGYNTEALRKRVESAVMATVIGPEHRELITKLLERADKFRIRKAVAGLMHSAPHLIKLKGTSYDISPYLQQALADLVRLRGTSENVETFLASRTLVGNDGRSAASDQVLEFLAKAKSMRQVSEDLGRYVTMARNAIADSQSGGLFGDMMPAAASREQIIGEIYGKVIRPSFQPEAAPAIQTSEPAAEPAPVAEQPELAAPGAAAAPSPGPAAVAEPPAPIVMPAAPAPMRTASRDFIQPVAPPRIGVPPARPTRGKESERRWPVTPQEIANHIRDEASVKLADRLGMPEPAARVLVQGLDRDLQRMKPGQPRMERAEEVAARLRRMDGARLSTAIQKGGLNGARDLLKDELRRN